MSESPQINWTNSNGRRRAITLGATTTRDYNWKSDGITADDLTTYTAELIVKRSFDDTESAVLTLTDSNGIALGDGSGTANIIFTFSESAVSGISAGRYQYTFNLINGLAVTQRLWEGNVQFTNEA